MPSQDTPPPDLLALLLDGAERVLLERLLVNNAPDMTRADKIIALSLWERLAEDTVA